MDEAISTFIEWTGINLLAAQIMAWLTANGALGMLLLGVLGVIVVFLAGAVIVHKLDRFPLKIPYARVLVPAAMVMAMLILLIVVGVGAVAYLRDGPGPPSGSHRADETPTYTQPSETPLEDQIGGQ